MQQLQKKSFSPFIRGCRDGIPIGLGYLSVSFAFGISAVSKGLPAWAAVLISMTNLTSAGQLAGLDLIVAGCTMGEMILTQCVINARYALMSISLTQKVDRSVRFLDRFWISFANTDEIFAVASGQPSLVGRKYLFGLILCPYFGWTLGTLFGTAASELLPKSIMQALGIAIYGMFIAIVIPPARRSRPIAAVLCGAVLLSCAFRYLPGLRQISSGFVIILCAVICAAAAAYFAPIADAPAEEAQRNEAPDL